MIDINDGAIDARGLVKQFGGHRVVGPVDLSVRPGEFLTLVGPSGCGKSTLLRLIAGLETASEGSISIAGRTVTDDPPKERDVAMVFQNYALYPHLTVAQNMAVPLRMRRLSLPQRLPFVGSLLPRSAVALAEIDHDVEQVAQSLGIAQLLSRKPAQLSGGQRQRVALGRAIVRKPRVFLLDEPLSNLDAQLRVQMRSELVQLHRRLQVTLIYVTHDQAEAMTMSNRIAVMFAGNILQIGTPEAVYDDPDHLKVASFISNPGLNTMPFAAIANTQLGRQIGAMASGSAGCTVAFRPEACTAVSSADQTDLSGRVIFCERFGAEAFAHIAVDHLEHPIIARIEPAHATRLTCEQLVRVNLDISKLFLFGPDGLRLRPRRRAAA
ncbi:multiple sugar transport system ATP-binding protein [Neorhizobium sp. 2083]|uniref:ABC transporter ATP-binding protein n=1 Tax=Neorhizobium sp. 2083 TaxID=2817762 RepID=UPI0028542F8E|nr:ABC transporter ATP-binding protein [Neorhizobium sp. 2083]MDR6820390.1 multiple sugar transport system ATP-binding protein [Neorhizobium sp. 2083]